MSRRSVRSRGVVHYVESESLISVRLHVPFPNALKERIKGVVGSRWHPPSASWHVPDSQVASLLMVLHGEPFEVSAGARELFERSAQLDVGPVAPASIQVTLTPIEREAASYRARQQSAMFAGASDAPSLDASAEASSTEVSPTEALPAGALSAEPSLLSSLARGSDLRESLSSSDSPHAPAAEVLYPHVREILKRASRALSAAFSRREWVVGVAQGITRSARGHLYFRLMDAEEVHTPGVTSALDVAVFGDSARRLERTLGAHRIALQEGMLIALVGELQVYGPKSGLQFVAQDVDPRVSRGEVELQRDRVVSALRDAELSQRNTRQPLPLLPQRIALVTSGRSDALHDVLKTLRAGQVGASVELLDVVVQGPQLEESVLRALHELQLRAAEFDLVLIVRGGGAANELAWWDNYAVGAAIANLRLPVVLGIGHERDVSALHEVARYEATPTAAATRVVRAWAEARQWQEQRSAQVMQRSTVVLDASWRALERSYERFQHGAERRLDQARLLVDRGYPTRIVDASERALARRSEALEVLEAQLGTQARRTMSWQARRLAQAESGVSAEGLHVILAVASETLLRKQEELSTAMARRLDQARRELSLSESLVRASDPHRWLSRGYAIVRDAEGRALRDVEGLHQGAAIDVELARGRIRATVVDVLDEDLLGRSEDDERG